MIFDMEQDRVGIAKHKAINSTIEYGLAYSIDTPNTGGDGNGGLSKSKVDPVITALTIIIVACLVVVLALGGVWLFVWTKNAPSPFSDMVG
jgi:hypothetical protein